MLVMRLPILAAAILILSLTLPNLEVVSASDKPSVSFSVETDRKSYVRGEVVRITLNAKNTGVETVTYSFGNECEGFRIMILNSTGSNLGVSGFGPPVCRYATRTLAIQPGQTTIVASGDWNTSQPISLLDKNGFAISPFPVAIPRGKYSVVGVLNYLSAGLSQQLASENIIIHYTSDTDTTHPTWPSGATLTASNMTQSSSFLSWTPAEDNVGVIGYGITANGTAIFCCERGDTTSVAIFFLEPGTTYLFKVVAADSSANWNMDGPTVTVTTPP